MNKVSIIGTGSVGSTIAYTLTVMGLASEIVMIDINNEKALGEALDIRQGTPFCGPCSIYAGSYRDAEGSNIVIITSGIARRPGQSRLDLAQTNVNIIKSIIPQITKYAPNAKYIIVSNPVDILDTARLRSRLSEYYKINQQNVHAYVMGEHGDSSFIPWSVANISNVPLSECDKLLDTKNIYPDLDYAEIENYVRKSGARVIERKGATFYAVSISVCHIIKSLLSGIDTTMTVSTMMHGEYGIDDVCLSVLNIVGSEGAHGKILVPLTDSEIEQLHHSADCLKNTIKSIEL